jgi:PAS domain-containing protein
MWVFDRHTLRIVLANPAAGRLLGHAPEALHPSSTKSAWIRPDFWGLSESDQGVRLAWA